MAALAPLRFFQPQNPGLAFLARGSMAWFLAHFLPLLFPVTALLPGWRGHRGTGRRAWPEPVLIGFVLMRWDGEGLSRRAAHRQAYSDLAWRAAMGLRPDHPFPSERTLRDFEHFLQQRHPHRRHRLFRILFEHVGHLCVTSGMVSPTASWVIDSTPTHPYGAVRDTIGLLGEGLKRLARGWAKATNTTLQALAEQWQLPLLTAKSTKGAYLIDWTHPQQRRTLIDQLGQRARSLVRWVRSRLLEVSAEHRSGLLRSARHLARVLRQDLDGDANGTMRLARRTSDRLISLTDPQARRFYKSKTQPHDGFKTHAIGDPDSHFIAAVSVSAGNRHDGELAFRLVRRAKSVVPFLAEVLGDAAYGGARLRRVLRESLSVKVIAPPAAIRPPRVSGRYIKSDFQIDFSVLSAVCPQGEPSEDGVVNARGERTFRWSASVCGSCSARLSCRPGKRVGKRLRLHAEEEELRRSRAEWRQAQTRTQYRGRSPGEGLMRALTRHGARQARAWGLRAAEAQAYLIATVSNLKQLAKYLTRERNDEEIRSVIKMVSLSITRFPAPS